MEEEEVFFAPYRYPSTCSNIPHQNCRRAPLSLPCSDCSMAPCVGAALQHVRERNQWWDVLPPLVFRLASAHLAWEHHISRAVFSYVYLVALKKHVNLNSNIKCNMMMNDSSNLGYDKMGERHVFIGSTSHARLPPPCSNSKNYDVNLTLLSVESGGGREIVRDTYIDARACCVAQRASCADVSVHEYATKPARACVSVFARAQALAVWCTFLARAVTLPATLVRPRHPYPSQQSHPPATR